MLKLGNCDASIEAAANSTSLEFADGHAAVTTGENAVVFCRSNATLRMTTSGITLAIASPRSDVFILNGGVANIFFQGGGNVLSCPLTGLARVLDFTVHPFSEVLRPPSPDDTQLFSDNPRALLTTVLNFRTKKVLSQFPDMIEVVGVTEFSQIKKLLQQRLDGCQVAGTTVLVGIQCTDLRRSHFVGARNNAPSSNTTQRVLTIIVPFQPTTVPLFSDPDNDTLQCTVSNSTSGISVDSNGSITVVPFACNESASQHVTVRCCDNGGRCSEQAISVTVSCPFAVSELIAQTSYRGALVRGAGSYISINSSIKSTLTKFPMRLTACLSSETAIVRGEGPDGQECVTVTTSQVEDWLKRIYVDPCRVEDCDDGQTSFEVHFTTDCGCSRNFTMSLAVVDHVFIAPHFLNISSPNAEVDTGILSSSSNVLINKRIAASFGCQVFLTEDGNVTFTPSLAPICAAQLCVDGTMTMKSYCGWVVPTGSLINTTFAPDVDTLLNVSLHGANITKVNVVDLARLVAGIVAQHSEAAVISLTHDTASGVVTAVVQLFTSSPTARWMALNLASCLPLPNNSVTNAFTVSDLVGWQDQLADRLDMPDQQVFPTLVIMFATTSAAWPLKLRELTASLTALLAKNVPFTDATSVIPSNVASFPNGTSRLCLSFSYGDVTQSLTALATVRHNILSSSGGVLQSLIHVQSVQSIGLPTAAPTTAAPSTQKPTSVPKTPEPTVKPTVVPKTPKPTVKPTVVPKTPKPTAMPTSAVPNKA